MKCAPVLGNNTPDHAVFFDNVMGADMGIGIAKPLQRRRPSNHAGVMKDQHVDPHRFGTGAVVRREALDCRQLDHSGCAPPVAIWS